MNSPLGNCSPHPQLTCISHRHHCPLGSPLWALRPTSHLSQEAPWTKLAYPVPRLAPVNTAVIPLALLLRPGVTDCHLLTWPRQPHTWSQMRSHFFSLSYCRRSRALSGGRFMELWGENMSQHTLTWRAGRNEISSLLLLLLRWHRKGGVFPASPP